MTVRKGIFRLGKYSKEPDFDTKCPEAVWSAPTPEYAAIIGHPQSRMALWGEEELAA